MKKIIYNNKLKKLLISILVIMILMSYVMPSVAFAATETIEHTDYDFSYKDWISLKDNSSYKETINKYGVDKYKEDIKNAAISGLCKTFYSVEYNEDSEKGKELAEDLLENSPEGVMINGTLEIGTNFLGGTVCKFEIIADKNQYGQKVPQVALKKEAQDNATEETMKYDELLEWSGKTEDTLEEEIIDAIIDKYLKGVETFEGGATQEEVAKEILKLNRDIIEVKVIGTEDNYKITDLEVPGKDEYTVKVEAGESLGIPTAEDDEDDEDSADLGGILLSPFFYLVNFIADAITSNLGRIMIGDDLSFSNATGTKVLQSAKIAPEAEGKYHEYPVDMDKLSFLGGTQYPNIPYTPEEIFAGKIDLLSIDFISGKNYEGNDNENDGWNSIRKTISQWYQVLRTIAIIGLLSVLIYIGIKIIISANAKDKAKYKEWIISWFMAVAILFSMHIIMAFIISVTGEFSKLLSEASQKILIVNGSEKSVTNLMGLVRFMIQSEDFYMKVGYEAMYIALIVYTIKFTVVYLKRVLNMAFLTLIAPIVALTYPIDKLNDGNAKGFDMWVKEYIFNALLQPMHQVMYYILVGSAIGIAASNPIYGIVVLMFMTEAEKLLKNIFGFGKANGGTVGGMTGAFAAGAIASNIKNIARLAGGKGGNGGNGMPKNDAIEGIKPTEDPSTMSSFDDGTSPALTSGSQQTTPTDSSTDNNEQPSVEQRMVDTYDENNFGTSDYDSAERESMARDANTPESQELSDEEKRQHLRDQGWSEQEINDTLGQPENSSQSTTSGAQTTTTNNSTTDTTTTTAASPQSGEPTPTTDPIDDLAAQKERQRQEKEAKRNRRKKGAKALAKSVVRPIYDVDRSGKYNAKRWARRIGKAAIGGAVGITAAAVQAGISITDGKYDLKEGFLAFSGGFAGGNQIVKGIGGLVDTYYEGANAGDKDAQLLRAQSKYEDREDVIRFNQRNYAGREKEVTQRQKNNWMKYGYNDPKEMKSGIKYADAWIKQTYGDSFNGLSDDQKKKIWEQADDRAAQTMAFRDRLKSQGQTKAIYEEDKRNKYIEEMVKQEAAANASDADKDRIRNRYRNAFKAIVEYDNAQ